MDVIRPPDRTAAEPQPLKDAAAAAVAGDHEAAREAVAAEDAQAPKDIKYIFQLVRAPSVTPAVKVLLEGPMDAAIRSLREDGRESRRAETHSGSQQMQIKEGDGLEISPLAMATCDDIARRITSSKGGGAALLIDYGEDFTQVSLQFEVWNA